jgi:putative Ca2+/H+ antiporter (TMEM165/GDT1 family)
MAAFLLCLVLAFLIETGGRAQLLSAILADRFNAAPAFIAGITLATLLNAALSAGFGVFMHSMMSAKPLQLFQALALLFASAAMLIPERKLDRLSGWTIGPLSTGALGMAIMQFGDSSQFFILATAARENTPIFAFIGGSIGVMAALFAGILLGEADLAKLPLRPIRRIIGAVLGLFGLWQALLATGIA